MMRHLSVRASFVCVAVFGCGAAAGIALTVGLTAGNHAGTPTTLIRQTTSSSPRTVPSDLGLAYGFLTSASSAGMPASIASNLGWPGAHGVNPALGREAGSVGTERLWLVPGRSESCLELDAGDSACGSNELVERQGVWLMLKPVSGAAPSVYGIVPDGTTVSGNAATVLRSGNAVKVTPSSSSAGQFAIRTASGVTVDMPVPTATGHPQ